MMARIVKVLSIVLICAFGPAGAPAAERALTTAADSGAGSLREALAGAEAGDVIVIPESVGMVKLERPVDVGTSVTVRGSGDGVGIEAADGVVTQFLGLAEGVDLALENVLMRGAVVLELDRWTRGSVVFGDWRGTVTARGCRFEGNAGPITRVELAQFYDGEFRDNLGRELMNCGLLQMKGCLAEDNEGGVEGALVRLFDTVVRGCSGRAAVWCCTGVLRRCLIVDNVGTGLHCDPDPGQVLMTGCSVVRNGNGGLGDDNRAPIGPGMGSGEEGRRWFHDELRPGYYRVRALTD